MQNYSNIDIESYTRSSGIQGYIKSIFLNYIEVFLFICVIFGKVIWLNNSMKMRSDLISLHLASIGTALVLAGISLWFNRKGRIITLLVLDTAVTVIMAADMIFYRYFYDVISIAILRQAVLMDTLQSSINSLVKPIDILFYHL